MTSTNAVGAFFERRPLSPQYMHAVAMECALTCRGMRSGSVASPFISNCLKDAHGQQHSEIFFLVAKATTPGRVQALFINVKGCAVS